MTDDCYPTIIQLSHQSKTTQPSSKTKNNHLRRNDRGNSRLTPPVFFASCVLLMSWTANLNWDIWLASIFATLSEMEIARERDKCGWWSRNCTCSVRLDALGAMLFSGNVASFLTSWSWVMFELKGGYCLLVSENMGNLLPPRQVLSFRVMFWGDKDVLNDSLILSRYIPRTLAAILVSVLDSGGIWEEYWTFPFKDVEVLTWLVTKRPIEPILTSFCRD